MLLCKCCLERLKNCDVDERVIDYVINQFKNIPVKLLPCPKCGSSNILFDCNNANCSEETSNRIICYDCGYSLPEIKGDKNIAANIWNSGRLLNGEK